MIIASACLHESKNAFLLPECQTCDGKRDAVAGKSQDSSSSRIGWQRQTAFADGLHLWVRNAPAAGDAVPGPLAFTAFRRQHGKRQRQAASEPRYPLGRKAVCASSHHVIGPKRQMPGARGQSPQSLGLTQEMSMTSPECHPQNSTSSQDFRSPQPHEGFRRKGHLPRFPGTLYVIGFQIAQQAEEGVCRIWGASGGGSEGTDVSAGTLQSVKRNHSRPKAFRFHAGVEFGADRRNVLDRKKLYLAQRRRDAEKREGKKGGT